MAEQRARRAEEGMRPVILQHMTMLFTDQVLPANLWPY